MKKLIAMAVLLSLVLGSIAFAAQNEELASMTQSQNQMNALMMGLLSGIMNNQGSGGQFDPNSDSGKLLVQTLNVMLAQLIQQNQQNPNEEVTNILNMIVPLMQAVNGMMQQQAPANR